MWNEKIEYSVVVFYLQLQLWMQFVWQKPNVEKDFTKGKEGSVQQQQQQQYLY